jgi:FAD synthetase
MKIKVMTFGTFDFLHAGHEFFLKEARKLGDELITVLARDKTVKQVKGETPLKKENERKKDLEDSGLTDKVILGNLEDKYEVIKKHKPDIICLGYDQYAFTQKLQKTLIDLKLDTKIIRLNSYKPDMYKSSIIKNSIS